MDKTKALALYIDNSNCRYQRQPNGLITVIDDFIVFAHAPKMDGLSGVAGRLGVTSSVGAVTFPDLTYIYSLYAQDSTIIDLPRLTEIHGEITAEINTIIRAPNLIRVDGDITLNQGAYLIAPNLDCDTTLPTHPIKNRVIFKPRRLTRN